MAISNIYKTNRQNYKLQAKLTDFFLYLFLKNLDWHKVYNIALETSLGDIWEGRQLRHKGI